ncbi:hypothetical protein HanPSC8_Chr11g0454091 [Helianthus annuus]|nr:hypothetical protein HanPSC8_Chr11g0454091 [Helianthus annuus]
MFIRLSVLERYIAQFLNIKHHGAPEHHYRGHYEGGKSWSCDRHSGVNICTIFPLTNTYIYTYMYVQFTIFPLTNTYIHTYMYVQFKGLYNPLTTTPTCDIKPHKAPLLRISPQRGFMTTHVLIGSP